MSVARLGNVKSTVSTVLRKEEIKRICVQKEGPAIVKMHKEEMDSPAM